MSSSILKKKPKLMFLGDCGVGKSEFIRSYKNIIKSEENKMKSIDTKKINPTICMDTETMFVAYDNENDVKIEICDTSGKDQYKNIYKSMMSLYDAFIIVYDVNNQKSMINIISWINYVIININVTEKSKLFFIIGNKIDILSSDDSNNRKDIIVERWEQYKETMPKNSIIDELLYNEASAVTCENVTLIMDYILYKIIDNYESEE